MFANKQDKLSQNTLFVLFRYTIYFAITAASLQGSVHYRLRNEARVHLVGIVYAPRTDHNVTFKTRGTSNRFYKGFIKTLPRALPATPVQLKSRLGY